MMAPLKPVWKRRLAYLLLLVVAASLAWLSQQWSLRLDLTQAKRNTLQAASSQLLQQLQAPVELIAYLPANDKARVALRDLIGRYQDVYPAMSLEIRDPSEHPQEVRELNIASGGELLLHYRNQEQRLQQVSESSITNALQRMLRQKQAWLVFLQGHGERDPLGKANADLGEFGTRLSQSGFHVQGHDFLLLPAIPDNTQVLVIAGPRSAYLPGEVALLQLYLRRGGNLLWLAEPGDDRGYQELAQELGIHLLPGVIVDAASEKLQLKTPDFALASAYPDHPITQDLHAMSLFPQAAAIVASPSGWVPQNLVQSSPQSWNETGPISGEISQDRRLGEMPGPLSLGLALSRPQQNHEQRVVVLGDGDFLSNAYLSNGANLELGLRIMNWLSGDDLLIKVQQQPDPDITLDVSNTSLLVFAGLFLVVVPVGLGLTGLLLWWRRRHA